MRKVTTLSFGTQCRMCISVLSYLRSKGTGIFQHCLPSVGVERCSHGMQFPRTSIKLLCISITASNCQRKPTKIVYAVLRSLLACAKMLRTQGTQQSMQFAYSSITQLCPTLRRPHKYFSCVLSCSAMSDSLRSHRLQSTMFLCLWDSPSKNIGVDCHFLLRGSSQPRG